MRAEAKGFKSVEHVITRVEERSIWKCKEGTNWKDGVGRFVSKAFFIGLICAAALAGVTSKQLGAASDEESAKNADRGLIDALGNANKTAVGSLLDTNFAWTDADGKTRTKSEALENLPALAADSQGDTNAQTHDFGQVERIVGEHHSDRFVRIWVKRPAGWRAFLVLDVPIPAKGYTNHPTPPRAADKDCVNPCRVLPYKPANAAQEAAVQTWLKLKMDEWHAIEDDWPTHVSETMVTMSPGMYMSKEERLALLVKQHEAYGDGSPSAPVDSMRMFDFGNTVIMTAIHGAKAAGKPSYAIRMFVNEGGEWRIALSAQTDIQ